MGRLIDVSDLHNVVMLNKSDWGIFATPIDQLVERLVSQVSTVEAILKADYENRLKADMVAMLTEIQLEIEEHDPGCGWEGYADKNVIDCIIQERINSLKGE